MRRLNVEQERERGGISVIVALLMVVLLGFTAIAVDVGMLYSEKAQLQNGADAAALLVAQKCATSNADPNCAATSTLAASVLSGNALDGRSNIKSLGLDLPNRTVSVTAGAQEQGKDPNRVTLLFANALGIASAEVIASATVRWGSPLEGTTPFPLAFSVCQVAGMVGGASQLLQNHSSNANTDCGPMGSAGSTVPGGFGWIVQDPGSCGGSVNLAILESGSDTGNDGPSNCDAILNKWAAELTAGRDITVLLPVYAAVTGTGSGASYVLTSFAAFNVKGWKFSGGSDLPLVFHNEAAHVGSTMACTGNCRGIIGSFVKYVSLSDGYVLGPVSPYGATVVEFTS
ncbi:pilus assembly protein TadG-related protein [Pseudarthrobacter raffinosi]|uniref:pilus assembly protein TadG-related protein n=1 Tax=Pseudarthrobacter raffinosi TaxID=2953651 RepID=UPI00208F8C76|nr:TadE/TadG family type IV pilus assembly protein [Pseudarthrobacter sp. MDT3-9]MCO4253302.1 Tad domain-containing protein [Pseudarthrobacter sp. MDT3-9]